MVVETYDQDCDDVAGKERADVPEMENYFISSKIRKEWVVILSLLRSDLPFCLWRSLRFVYVYVT